MELRRAILWGIFIVSLLGIYDTWEQVNNRETFVSSWLRNTPPASDPKKIASQPTSNVGAGSASSAVSPQNGASQVQPVVVGETVVVDTDVMKVSFDSVGATIKRVELLKHPDATVQKQNLVLLDDSKTLVYRVKTGLIGLETEPLPNHTMIYQLITDRKALQVKPLQDKVEVVWEAQTATAKLRKTFTFKRGKYDVDVKHEVFNLTTHSIKPILYLQLERNDSAPPGDTKFYSSFFGPVVYTEASKYKKIALDDIAANKSERHDLQAQNGWIGFVQHYFLSAWILPLNTPREIYTDKKDELYRIGNRINLPELPVATNVAFSSKLYVGPQDQDELSKLADHLDLVVDYGWLGFIAKPVFLFMQWLHSLIGNWGWTVVALTLVVKLLFFPLAASGYRSSAKIKKLEPKIKAIQERYKEDPMRVHREKAALFKAENISMLGGCLPILLSVPVFMALYWVLQASIEMRYSVWIDGWINNLAAPDPWYILPSLYMITMVIQLKFSPQPADKTQARVMMAMPFIFGVMFFFFPAGLVLYWVVSNIFSLIQQAIIYKQLEKAGLK